MDIIIRLIIKIFKEVFEQDSERRRTEQKRRQELVRQWHLKKQAQQQGRNQSGPGTQARSAQTQGTNPAGQPKKPDFMRQIEALFGEIAPPDPPPPPPSLPKPKPVRERYTRQSRYTSTSGKQKPKRASVPKKPKKKGFVLPGKTPLEQLILAKVILDPCKGMKDDLI